jgi:hypothetical protein
VEFINKRLKQTITVAVEEQLKRELKEIFNQ